MSVSISSLRTCFSALLAVLGTDAFANSFNFSYEFSSGTLVSGSFDGTLGSGGIITGISNVALAVNGAPTTGLYFSAHFDGGGWANDGFVSSNASANNFLFIDSDLLNGDWAYTHQFWFVLGSLPSGVDPLGTYLETPLVVDADGPSSLGTWKLQQAHPSVPDETPTALGLGTALVLAIWLRRRFAV